MQANIINNTGFYLQKIANYSRVFGSNIIPYLSDKQIASIDSSQIDVILDNLLKRLNIYSIIQPDVAPNLKLEVDLFQKALELNALYPADDITKKFEFGDIIEIYDLNYTQIYANLQFLKLCSYDLFTLNSKPFYELYSRNQDCNNAILQEMEKCFFEYKSTQPFKVEPHFIKEIFLNKKDIFKVHPKWISPLFDSNNQVKACVLTNYSTRHEVSVVQ
jgi:hypothetical protein